MWRLFAVVLLVVGGVACGRAEDAQRVSPSPEIEREEIDGFQVVIRGRAEVSAGAAEIDAGDNFFNPTILTAPAEAEVSLTVRNRGTVLHNFSLSEQGIDQDFDPGSDFTLTVAFPAEGRLVFFCKYHREESGMLGALDVTMS